MSTVASPDSAPVLEASDVTVTLAREDADVVLFEDLALTVHPAETLDVSGPSGSGKSTLLRVLARMQPVSSARLSLNGTDSTAITPQQWRRRVALVPQVGVAFPGTVKDNLLSAWRFTAGKEADKPGEKDLRDLLDAVLLNDIGLTYDAHRLSVGQLARVALLRVLVTDPDVLLMDEVDAALDPDAAHAVALLVRERTEAGMACLRVRHRDPDGFATGRLEIRDRALVRRDV